jgi:uncharacterized iron-regulated membrane protein
MKRQQVRRFWLKAHLNLGLVLGGFLVLLGLTGSLLVFYNEIDRTINPSIGVRHTNNAVRPSLEAVFNHLTSAYPNISSAWRIELPLSTSHPVMARHMKPAEKKGFLFAPLVVTVDPNTLKTTSSRLWGDFVMTWIYDLHYTLLLEELGKTILAIISMLSLILIFAGLYLWWPNKGKFKAALAIRTNTHFIRRVYDWHKLTGVLGFGLIFTLLTTGIMLEKPLWFESALSMPKPMYQIKNLQSQHNIHTRLNIDAIANIVVKLLPNAELRWIYTPENEQGVYQVRMYQKGEPSRRFPKTTIWLDQYSGDVLAIRNAKNDAIGDKIVAWLHPLHNGEAFGLTGRWVVFISGFLPLILFVSGILRWLQKKKSKINHKIRS